MEKKTSLFYLNRAQVMALKPMSNILYLVGGRGIGKGTVQGYRTLQVATSMVGSHSVRVEANLKRGLTNTWPSVAEALERLGFKKDVHWVVGVKPTKNLMEWWAKPATATQNYENYVTFYNGSQIFIASQDRPGTSNGMNFDHVFMDEAKFLNHQQLKDETFPANRGHNDIFGGNPLHHGQTLTCDMPATTKGSWFLSGREKATPDINNLVEKLMIWLENANEAWQEGVDPDTDRLLGGRGRGTAIFKQKYKERLQMLAQMRASAFLYLEMPSWMNIEILGESFIMNAKRDLPRLTFLTSICCIRIGKVEGGFYGSFTDKHQYDKADVSAIKMVDMYDGHSVRDMRCKADGDLDPQLPIFLSFDYNANINWLCAWQPGAPGSPYNPPNAEKDFPGQWICRCLRSFFVKYERKLPELIEDFYEYYQSHFVTCNQVYILIDNTAKNANYAVNDHDFAWVIQAALEAHGINVVYADMGKQMGQYEKYELINGAMLGTKRMVPMFNREGNEHLIPALEATGIRNGKKDKSAEKRAESVALKSGIVEDDESRLESRTDSTDAADQGMIFFNSPLCDEYGTWWRYAGGNSQNTNIGGNRTWEDVV